MSAQEQAIKKLELEASSINIEGHSTWWWIAVICLISIGIAALTFVFLQVYSSVVGDLVPTVASVDKTATSAAISENLRSQFGSFGDAVGGLFNPFLTFISIVLLIFTLMQNQRAMRQSAAALKHAEVQLRISILEQRNVQQELKASRTVQSGIEQTQKQQRFDSSFFQMLRLHNEILDSIDLHNRNSTTSRGRDCFVTFRARLTKNYNDITMQQNILYDEGRIQAAYDEFWEDGKNELGHYFRFLFNLYRFIDESTGVDKKFYSNLVRAQLSDQELFILFYNCLTPQGDKFMKYAIEYALFDNMHRSGLMSPSHENLVDEKVFGE